MCIYCTDICIATPPSLRVAIKGSKLSFDLYVCGKSAIFKYRAKMKAFLLNATVLIIITLQLFNGCTATPVAPVIPDQLSLVTRYAGMGYNALQANPEGDFSQAAVNPGIKITRFIFNFTYCEGKRVYYRGQPMQVPDQVEFHPRITCVNSETSNAYSGQTSYKNELSSSVDISGKLFNYHCLYKFMHTFTLYNIL